MDATMRSPLLTDLYQLTMAQGYWRHGLARSGSVFHLFARRAPFGGAFVVVAGLGSALERIESLRFERSDLDYLSSVREQGRAVFEDGFLSELESFEPECSVDAMPEGTLAVGGSPVLRVEGPLLEAQLYETMLLNVVGQQSLIATKSARVCHLAAGGQPVVDFGLRRAAGPDGGLSASLAAVVGGCQSSSNVLAGKVHSLPLSGTHAHSWVLSFPSELEAFRAYAEVYPDATVLLIDTYDTLSGLEAAIEVGEELRRRGHELKGVRLDSGDLLDLSLKVRARLDEAGFPEVRIVASGDMDEYRIATLRSQGAAIDIWGVGTRMITGWGEPALACAYKLSAIDDRGGTMRPVLKRSETPGKSSDPGRLQVLRRVSSDGDVDDLLIDLDSKPHNAQAGADGDEVGAASHMDARELLAPVMRGGQRLAESEAATTLSARVADAVARAPASWRQLDVSHPPRVRRSQTLERLRNDLIERAGVVSRSQ